MVSTRQMTGASSEESSMHLFRAVSNSPSSPTTSGAVSIISSHSTSNKTVTTVSHQIDQSSPATSSTNWVTVSPLPPCSTSNLANDVLAVSVLSPGMIINPQQNHQHRKLAKNLTDLPPELLGHIFSFVGYRKIAQMRVISRQMNQVCSAILNSTFQKLQHQMHSRFQTVKAKMPRRESARRNHPLACECDILETCYMRLSLLQMTFGKHIERKHCCFFPGGILDEVYSVLNYIRTSSSLDRPFKVTDELFDLSTMAMEYFKEHIEPNLPDIAYFTNSTKSFVALETSSSNLSRDASHSNSSSPPQSNMVLRKGIRKIKQGMKRYNNQLTVLRSELRTCKRKATEQTKTITEQQKLLAEQQKQTLEFANRLDETDKKNDELSRKFSTVLQELNKCKTELQYWRSKSPATTNYNSNFVQVISPICDLQTMGDQSETADDIELFSAGVNRGAMLMQFNEETTKKKDESGQLKERFEQPSQKCSEREEAGFLEFNDQSQQTLKPVERKRKSECLGATDSYESSNVECDKGLVRLDGLACLNPPFASASLVASYSSSSPSPTPGVTTAVCDGSKLTASRTTLPSKEGNELDNTELLTDLGYVNVDAPDTMNVIPRITSITSNERSLSFNLPFVSSKPFFSTTKAIQVPHTNHVLNDDSSSFSKNVDSKNDSTSNENSVNHNKKLRRVQNKARSQNNTKNTNQNSTTNTHIKTTRSKQSDK